MYFKGRLSIDPSQLTKIQTVPPGSGFKKLIFGLTGGSFGSKKEVETFKALNILEQIHAILSSQGINNIIRLTHDDIDIYHDKSGEENDLEFALDKYQVEINDAMSTHFETLQMVLEHEDEQYKYLIEVSVNRSHATHEYPIEMTVSAMLKEFTPKPGESKDQLKAKMKSYFASQEAYDMFVTTRKLAFEQFLESIRFETMKHIRVDDIKMEIRTRMVMQNEKQAAPQQTATPTYEGTPYGYFGFTDLILYAWLWSELSFDHNIHLSNVDLVTDGGDLISSVGADGFDAADTSIMDYNEDFDTRMDEMDASGVDLGDADATPLTDFTEAESSKSWFDGVFDDGGDFDFDLGDW